MILCHLTNIILIGADERTARVSIAGGVTSGASADHVLSYVAWVIILKCYSLCCIAMYLQRLTRNQRQSGLGSGSTEGG